MINRILLSWPLIIKIMKLAKACFINFILNDNSQQFLCLHMNPNGMIKETM